MIPVEDVGASSSPAFLGVFKAAIPTITTPMTITAKEIIWCMYYFLPRNHQARNAVMITIAPLII
jgi:hypothetical protein